MRDLTQAGGDLMNPRRQRLGEILALSFSNIQRCCLEQILCRFKDQLPDANTGEYEESTEK